jgi:hypothetical protein
MQRLCFLNRLSVFCALLGICTLLTAQHGYACSWQAELINYTTQETTHLRIDATPVQMPLVQVDRGVDVHCSLAPSAMLSIGILEQHKVDIVCRYPDGQMITARAITIFDIFTGETIAHPVILFFSNARKEHETLYRLYVNCQ